MTGSIAAVRLAALAGDFDRSPAYAGLADRLRLLIAGARVDVDLRLPSERDLCVALGVSRTTVTRAYAPSSMPGTPWPARGRAPSPGSRAAGARPSTDP